MRRWHSIEFLVLLAVVCMPPGSVFAQEPEHPPEHHHEMAAPPDESWTWTADANAFFGYNYQQRRFADFWAWESQNWGMLSAERGLGRGRLNVQGMISLEPWTIGTLVYAKIDTLFSGQKVVTGGSPQVFQTGESYQASPLINVQHPHDLLMGLGATYRVPLGRATYTFEADLVGSPALGPTAFMHRESARDNPQVPLAHHYMDSTHMSAGVVTAGVEAGPITLEASTFRGEEPSDDNRANIETPKLDSWSARASWRHGGWQAQFSGGRLHTPEWFEPVDVVRLTASIGFNGEVKSKPLAVTVAWGENREYTFALDGYLVEWDLRATGSSTIYGRAESVLKEIFGLGVHPQGLLNHPRFFSTINALTVGYVYDVPKIGHSRLGVGADITVYNTSVDLFEYYGSPHSYHVFVRWRPTRTSPAHVH